MTPAPTLEHAARLDAQDPLAHCRERFTLPPGVIYLDGNSLGALPRSVLARVARAVEHEWGVGLIRSWNEADWYPAPQRVGGRIAPLIGAHADEVIVADSTSINLFKVLAAALRMRAGRRRILGERGNFPTDAYVASGAAELMNVEFVALEPEAVAAAIDERVAIVSLTHVNYKTGRMYDMAGITRRAHAAGALVVWDLCHTAGAMSCALNACQADFAVGCGYKYLNGDPGAPGFVFIARRHQELVHQPLTGWFGHARFEQPFGTKSGASQPTGIIGNPPSGLKTSMRSKTLHLRSRDDQSHNGSHHQRHSALRESWRPRRRRSLNLRE